MENMSVSLSHIVHSSSSICSSQSDSVTYPPEMRPLQPSGTRGDTAETTITSTVGITDPSQTTSLSRSNADYNQIELDQGDRSLSVGEQVSLSGLVEDNVAMREQTVSKRNPSEITATESSRSGKQLDDIVENARSKSHFGEPGQSSLKIPPYFAAATSSEPYDAPTHSISPAQLQPVISPNAHASRLRCLCPWLEALRKCCTATHLAPCSSTIAPTLLHPSSIISFLLTDSPASAMHLDNDSVSECVAASAKPS
eukprot:2638281-Rhodomonas_salina.1